MSPRGREHGMAGGTGTVNNKIYYPSGRPREGADGERCSLELAVRYGGGWGGSLEGSLRGWRRRGWGGVLWPVSSPSQRAEDREMESVEVGSQLDSKSSPCHRDEAPSS